MKREQLRKVCSCVMYRTIASRNASKLLSRTFIHHSNRRKQRETKLHAAALEQLKRNRAAMGNDDTAVGTATSGNPKFDAEFNARFAELAKSMPPRKKRKWVDPTPANGEGSVANNGSQAEQQQQESEAPTWSQSDQKQAALEAPPSVASVPGNTANDTPRPPSQTTGRPTNPYAKPDTSAIISASKTNTDKVSPTSVSDAKISNTNSVPPASARKPATSLRDFLQASTPATRKPSSSQPSASSSHSSSIGPWSCSACTFLNENNRWSRATCEMCGTQRAAPQETVLLDV